MIFEPNEGQPPSRTEPDDPSRWKVLNVSNDEDPCVTFQAGAITFTCRKSGKIYNAWEQEAHRQSHGGFDNPYSAEVVIVESGAPAYGKQAWEESFMPTPAAQMVDSQLEERQHRIGGLRKKAALMDWCDHDKGVCTGKCALLDEIRGFEKKILGDP